MLNLLPEILYISFSILINRSSNFFESFFKYLSSTLIPLISNFDKILSEFHELVQKCQNSLKFAEQLFCLRNFSWIFQNRRNYSFSQWINVIQSITQTKQRPLRSPLGRGAAYRRSGRARAGRCPRRRSRRSASRRRSSASTHHSFRGSFSALSTPIFTTK